MEDSDFILAMQKRLRYSCLITNIGPVSRDYSDHTKYYAKVEFSPIESSSNPRFNGSKPFTEIVDSSILGTMILGNVWTRDAIIQNVTLAREKATFDAVVDEASRSPRALYSHLGIANDDESLETSAQSFMLQNIPITKSSLFSLCLKFPIKGIELSSKVDEVIIPCSELVRALFFRSELLLKVVLNGTLKDVCSTACFEQDDSQDDELAIIVTDKKYDEVEEYVFADILYNSELFNSYEVVSKKLDARLMVNSSRSAHVSTYLPMTHRRIHACGVYFQHRGRYYFYVNQIYSFDYKPTFRNFHVFLMKDCRQSPAKEGAGTKHYEHKLVKYDGKKGQKKEVSTEAEGRSASEINPITFHVQTEDIFKNDEVPSGSYADKEPQDNKYNGKTLIIKSDSRQFTTNLNRGSNSGALAAKINNTNGGNSGTPDDGGAKGYEFTVLTEALGKINGSIQKAKKVEVAFFNCQNSIFSATKVINTVDAKKDINALIARISHDGRIIYVFDFTGLQTRRIVCVYNNRYWKLTPTAILEFIVLVKTDRIIPRCDTYKDKKEANPNLKWVNWDRLNVGELKISDLTNRLLELAVKGYKVPETKKS